MFICIKLFYMLLKIHSNLNGFIIVIIIILENYYNFGEKKNMSSLSFQ